MTGIVHDLRVAARALLRRPGLPALAVVTLALGVGLAASLLAGRLLRGYLYGVGAADPVTLAVVSAVLVGVTAAVAWLPARRAAHVDPVDALRFE